jgi:hypothetical protein
MKFIDFQQWSNLRNGKQIHPVISMISSFHAFELISPKNNSFIQYMYYFLTILSYGSRKLNNTPIF